MRTWNAQRYFTSEALPGLQVEAMVDATPGEVDYGGGIVKVFAKLMWIIIGATAVLMGHTWGAVALIALGVVQTFQTSRYVTFHYLRQGIDCRGTIGGKQFRMGWERKPTWAGSPYFLRLDGHVIHGDTFPREELADFLERWSDPLASHIAAHELEAQLEEWRQVPRPLLFPQLVQVLALRVWWTEDWFDRKYGYFA